MSADGAPYIQHRGGPKGFIKVLDEQTLGFADYAGNRQYITISNLAGNDRAYLFLLDFAHRQRIKVWGRARVVEDDPALLERLGDPGYRARPERAILFTVEAWDVNCSQHITERFTRGRGRRGNGEPSRTTGRAGSRERGTPRFSRPLTAGGSCPPGRSCARQAGDTNNIPARTSPRLD